MMRTKEGERLFLALLMGLAVHLVFFWLGGMVRIPEYRSPPPMGAVRVELGPSVVTTKPLSVPAALTPETARVDGPAEATPATKPIETPRSAEPAREAKPSSQPRPLPATSESSPVGTAPVEPQADPTEGETGSSRSTAAQPVEYTLPVPKPVSASSRSSAKAPALDFNPGDLDGSAADAQEARPAQGGSQTAAEETSTILTGAQLKLSGEAAGRRLEDQYGLPEFSGMPPSQIQVDFKVDANGRMLPNIKIVSKPALILPPEIWSSIQATLRSWNFTPAADPNAPPVQGSVTFTIVRK